MKGTTPPGAATEEQAARWVRDMFGGVAGRYDLLNHLLSFHIDRYWRARTVRRVRAVLDRPGVRAVDICCGTGDLTLALESARAKGGGGFVYGSDFCHPMLREAARKIDGRGAGAVLFESDALQLPLATASLDLITVAFGLRNFANYERGLAEMRRVLRPGGVAAVLEFSQPPNPWFRALYNLYSHRILPWIGGLISGSREAYSYLPDSVRKFPDGDGLAQRMRAAGFGQVTYERMTFGIVALHIGTA
jgi:demethylmenaquinone methyltransferase/2-methoxy-6-polyprenyl-1,4-benzoquinol methylase